MIGCGCTDEDYALGEEMWRASNGHKGIIGRKGRERGTTEGQTEGKPVADCNFQQRLQILYDSIDKTHPHTNSDKCVSAARLK